ncbi:MAG: DegT/DnrJ/EryC1/StrS family aminotransferase [Nitrospinae bacterium]|nr:DegT/DnrJ/EryC1/StrS family aminotransferase [Nitrospinota bacterium]
MISVFGSKIGLEELEEIRSSLENQWMGIGPKTARFEEEFRNRLGLTQFTLVNSGSNALVMAMKILDLPPGSEVVLPAFTWVSCAHAVVLAGHKPVFCDVDLETHNITRETVEPRINGETRAIMAVHYAGKPVRMETLRDFGLPLVEDAAHAVDSKLGNQYCGNMGDVGIYSFDAVKNLAMPEGGGITGKNKAVMEKTKLLRYCGIGKSGFESALSKPERWWEYNIIDICPKFIPNDVCASVGLVQLKKLDEHQAYRKRIWDTYQAEFGKLDWLATPKGPEPDEQHSYFTYCIRLRTRNRDKLAKHLLDKGIYTTLRYHPLHLNPIFKSSVKLPNCEHLNETALNLPIHPNLTDADVSHIVESVKAF